MHMYVRIFFKNKKEKMSEGTSWKVVETEIIGEVTLTVMNRQTQHHFRFFARTKVAVSVKTPARSKKRLANSLTVVVIGEGGVGREGGRSTFPSMMKNTTDDHITMYPEERQKVDNFGTKHLTQRWLDRRKIDNQDTQNLLEEES